MCVEWRRGAVAGLEHFEKAWELAKPRPAYASWAAYIEGTMLYLQGKRIPEQVIGAVKEEINAGVLRRLNRGLKLRGHASYKQDYLGD